MDRAKLFLTLTKPRIVSMVMVTTVVGYLLAPGAISVAILSALLLGTFMTSSGAAVLNNFLERDIDAQMERTKNRPLPAGLITPAEALAFGVLLVLLGTAWLIWTVNLLCAFLALLTAFLYVLVYTPLKRITWLNTCIGAIPGAIPPLGGWVAASGTVDLGAWILFGILYLWQHPHFYAIAWLCREDYAAAGLKMLPVVEPDGSGTFGRMILYSLVLLPISMLPSVIGMAGMVYLGGITLVGAFMLYVSLLSWKSRTRASALRVMRASIVYFPVMLLLILIDGNIW